MNATEGVANLLPGAILHPGVNLHQGANYAYKRGLSFLSCHFFKNNFFEPYSFKHKLNVSTLYKQSIKLLY